MIAARLARLRADEEGFTIIEVLVAAFILVLGSLAVFMTFAAAIHNVQRGKETQQGISVAQRVMERIRVEPYEDIGIQGAAMSPSPASSGLPTGRVSSGGNEFDVARPTSEEEFKEFVAGDIPPEPLEVNSPDGSKMTAYRFVVCEEAVGPEGECAAKRIVVDVAPSPADNQSGYRHSYYELQSTVVNPEG